MKHSSWHELLAGAVMVLVGLLLLLFLLGEIAFINIIPLSLVGIGVILTAVAVAKFKGTGSEYAMPPKAYLGYGVLAIVTGGLWLAVSIQVILAEFVLAGILILFGVVFLLYSTRKG
jgi:hypothetical protein